MTLMKLMFGHTCNNLDRCCEACFPAVVGGGGGGGLGGGHRAAGVPTDSRTCTRGIGAPRCMPQAHTPGWHCSIDASAIIATAAVNA